MSEDIITSHPRVVFVLWYGQGMYQAALFLEPEAKLSTEEKRDSFLDNISPINEQANQQNPVVGAALPWTMCSLRML